MGGFGPKVYPPTSGGSSGLQPALTSYRYRINYTTADTEVSQPLPSGTKQVYLGSEQLNAKMRVSWLAAGTDDAGDYLTVQVGNSYERYDLNLTGATIYFRANKSNIVIEIEVWV